MKKLRGKSILDTVLVSLFIAVALFCYFYWFIKDKNASLSMPEIATSGCILLLFTLLVIKIIPMLTKFMFFYRKKPDDVLPSDENQSFAPEDHINLFDAPPELSEVETIGTIEESPAQKAKEIEIAPLSLSDKDDKYTRLMIWGKIALFVLLTRIIIFVLAYVFARISGRNGDFISLFDPIWLHSGIDAPSYLGIAENFYVTSGDPMYHIVFFPFYSFLIKAFQLVFSNYFFSAMFVSNIAAIGVGIAGYELMRIDFDSSTALRYVKYIFILPAAFFYSAPMTESIFVLLCLLTLIFARKRIFWLSAIFGALAAFTRSPGMLLVIPVAIEAFHALKDTYHDERERFVPRLFGYAFSTLFIFSGIIAYIYINYSVWGNPLQFTVFQKEHWGQSMSYFFNTVQYQTGYAIKAFQTMIESGMSDWKYFFALYMPGLIYMFSSLIIVLFAVRKLRPSYSAYFCVYFAFVCGATWLLSAPRYLMASIVLPMAIALLTKKKWADITWTVVLSLLFLGYFYMYASSAPIY
ncbi:MAG: hypothetical protein RRY79_00540 [Clostridia bacterium]